MPAASTDVFVGINSHADTHHVAVVNPLGGHLGDREFPADRGGYRSLLDWVFSIGSVAGVGVEGTGTYGAQLGRVLTAGGLAVVEVNRPDRTRRRANGKSDPVDAYAAARAAASGRAASVPKSRDGIVESVRCLRVARRSAVKAKTECINQIRGLLISGRMDLREQTKPLGTAALIQALSRLRPGSGLSSPAAATKLTLRSLARRHIALSDEIRELDTVQDKLTTAAASGVLAKTGVGTDVASQLLVSAGDNPERLRSEASLTPGSAITISPRHHRPSR